MKPHRLAVLTIFLVLLGFTGISQGMLITHIQDPSLPLNVVYDDSADRYWIQDLGMFAIDTYNTQLQIIDNINGDSAYQSSLWRDWRLATLSDMETLWLNSYTDLRDTFEPSDADLHEITGRYENAGFTEDEGYLVPAHYYVGLAYFSEYKGDLPGTLIPDYVAEDWLGAWVTADSVITNPVPEPTTILLFGTGLVGLAGLRKKMRKK